MLTFNEIPRTKEKHRGGPYWTYERALVAYRPYAQPVTLVSREKKLKETQDSRTAPGTGWEMYKKRAHSIEQLLLNSRTRITSRLTGRTISQKWVIGFLSQSRESYVPLLLVSIIHVIVSTFLFN